MNGLVTGRSGVLRSLAVLAALASIGLAAGCGGDSDATDNSSSLVPSADQGALKSEVPSSFSGGIDVATQADIAPLTYTNDNGKTVGFDQDMLKAISDVLGVDVNVSPVTFENLILGLQSGKFDFVADTTITNERLAKYDMLSYFTSSYSVATLTDADDLGDDETVLCGTDVGVVTGEVISSYITDTLDPKCAAAGKDPVKTTEYKDFASAVLALKSENVPAIAVDTMTFSTFQAGGSGDDLDFNGPSRMQQSNSGYSFLKAGDATELAPVVEKAVDLLIKNGTYADLLKKYNLDESGLTGDSVLNPPSDL